MLKSKKKRIKNKILFNNLYYKIKSNKYYGKLN